MAKTLLVSILLAFFVGPNIRRDWLWKYKELIAKIVGNYLSIGIYLYERGNVSVMIEASLDFYPSNKEIRLLSEELLQRKFTFDKKLRGELN